MALSLRRAGPADAAAIAAMARDLTGEIVARSGVAHFDLDLARSEALARRWLEQGSLTVLLLERDAGPIAYAALSESRALYAEGEFGVIHEFWVAPAERGRGVGRVLLDAARAEARVRGWTRLEVTTPPLPAFERSLAFYRRAGFDFAGGRKLKLSL